MKMKEFRSILKVFKGIRDTLSGLFRLNENGKLRSERLKMLLTYRNEDGEGEGEGGLMPPNVEQVIEEFDQLIVWKRVAGGVNAAEVPEPQRGIDAEFDEANDMVDKIKEELAEYLKEIVAQFKDRRISYSHAKNRYELEIPEEHVKGNKKPKDFDFSSARAGFQRFQTATTKALVEQLEVAEDKLKDAMAPFLTAIFSKFHTKKSMWLQILSILGELDCLASLSIVSGHSEVPQCRPTFRREQSEEEHKDGKSGPSYLQLKKMVHPCVTLTGKQTFIPNDTLIDPTQD